MRVSCISPFIRTECGPPRTCLFCACLPLRSRSASGNSLLGLQLWQTMLAPYRACLWLAGYLQKRRAAAIGGDFLAFHFTFVPLLLLALPPQSSSHCYTRYIVLSWGLTTLQSLSLCPRRTAHFIYPPSRLILLFNGPLIYILHFSPRLHLVLLRNSSPSQPIYSPIS